MTFNKMTFIRKTLSITIFGMKILSIQHITE
jgi:hypothetical protein